MERRLNCWEYKKCGCGPEDSMADAAKCPAIFEKKLDGVHNGKNAGRTCWVIAGTYCNGAVQGKFAQKYSTCLNCDFYQMVLEEEGPGFEITLLLMKRLRKS